MSDNPEKLFALNPLLPTYNLEPASRDGLHARAFINFRNVHLLAFGGAGNTEPSLSTLSDENWVYFSSTSAAAADEDGEMLGNWERSSLIEIALQVMNVPQGRQFLLKVRMFALGSEGRVRVAIDRKVTETQSINEDKNTTLSLLLPTLPEQQWVYVDLKHIQNNSGEASALRFQSVSCYLV